MGLFDMASELLGGVQGGGSANALRAVLSMVNNHPGGLPGLITTFEQNGLGGAVNSWVSNGQNQAVSGNQIQNALGAAQLQDVASRLGMPPQMASSVIAEVLPGIINHLTPNGQVPSGNSDLMALGEGLLRNFIK